MNGDYDIDIIWYRHILIIHIYRNTKVCIYVLMLMFFHNHGKRVWKPGGRLGWNLLLQTLFNILSLGCCSRARSRLLSGGGKMLCRVLCRVRWRNLTRWWLDYTRNYYRCCARCYPRDCARYYGTWCARRKGWICNLEDIGQFWF